MKQYRGLGVEGICMLDLSNRQSYIYPQRKSFNC